MTKGQFIELVLEPGKASEYLPDEIGSLVEQFPYCQPLRFLQLRCFAGRQSIQYPAALKITSAYAPDRSRLFNLIHPAIESGLGYRSATAAESESETKEITADRGALEMAGESEASRVENFETKEDFIRPAMQVISGNEDEIAHDQPQTESALTPHPDKLLSASEKQEHPKDDIAVTDAQELLIQRLKELQLWPEDEEETIIEASGSPPSPSMSGLADIYPLADGQDMPEDELKEETLQFEYENRENPPAGQIQPVPTDYFSLPGNAGQQAIVLNDSNRDALTESKEIDARKRATDKLSFSDWLKSISNKKQHGEGEDQQDGIREDQRSLDGNGQPEKHHTGPSNAENRLQENPKTKVIYSRENGGNGTRRPHPETADEITGSTGEVPPSTADNPGNKKPIPDPMLVATDPPKPKLPADQLIDKFITEEPRITPSKSTFYSPVNMARKSVMETEDLVTETLAGIFARQGNFQKAIQYYEKLSLKFPEKSRYFAALIEELNKKLNS